MENSLDDLRKDVANLIALGQNEVVENNEQMVVEENLPSDHQEYTEAECGSNQDLEEMDTNVIISPLNSNIYIINHILNISYLY